MNVRTISYAPESVHRVRVKSLERPAWILCRRHSDIPIEDDLALRRLTEQGRVRPDDFLVNASCDSCVRAREIPELRVIFRTAAIRRIERVLPWLARAVATLWPESLAATSGLRPALRVTRSDDSAKPLASGRLPR